jgi:hypothetical protein
MANELAKFINSQRRHRDQNAVNRQVKIAKAHGLTNKDKAIKQPHRLAKHHVMDCGIPGCPLCSNPRRTHKNTLTAQEKRLFQDLDIVRDKKNNGTQYGK